MAFIKDNKFVIEKATLKVTSKAVDTDWFGVNIKPTRFPALHRIFIACPSETKVNLLMDDGSNTNIVMLLNDDTALKATALYVFDVVIPKGYSYNIQHKTTTQNISAWITEISGEN